MNAYPIAGQEENSAYPTESVSCDYSALDGSVRGVPDLVSVVSSSGSARGLCYYKDRWYFVQGDKLFAWQSGSPVQLVSGITGTDRAHFVPLSEHLVVRVADRIYTVVGNTASLVGSPASAPAEPTPKERRHYAFNLDVDYGGSATYGVSGDTFNLADVADSEPGAHRYLGSTAFNSNPPKFVGELVLTLQSWNGTISLNHPISLEVYQDADNATNRRAVPGSLTEIAYPYPTGVHKITALIEIKQKTGIKFHIRHYQVWRREVWAKNVITPTHYALTTVSGGVESQPRYFEINTGNSTGTLTDRWFSHFGGLPSGTWRLYRRDSAGVYRLVHEGTGATYTDYKHDTELGMKLVPNNPPTRGDYAIGWNRRCVVSAGNKLYISEAGRFSYGADSEVVDVDDTIIGLAVVRGVLYYATQHGWFALYGWGVNLSTQQVYAEPPPVGFVGDALALRSGGCLIVGEPPDRRNLPTLRKTIHLGTRKYWLATNGDLYIWYAEQNKWTKLTDNAADCVYHNGELYIQTSAGVRKYGGTRRAFSVQMTVPLETPMTFYEGRVEGIGSGTYEVQNRDGNWKTASGNLPLRLDRIENRYYELPIKITGNAGSRVFRLLMHLEPRQQLERK